MSSARRSDRLRRKRQTTPGLSQPGACKLYGSGYVVESEASFLPPPSNPRRSRYQNSPHILAQDSSPIPSTKQNNVAQRVQTSLFDILGSATRRPVYNAWPAFRNTPDSASQQKPEDIAIDDDADEQVVVAEGAVPHQHPHPVRRNLYHAFSAMPRAYRSSSWSPIFLLVLLLVFTVPAILLLQARVASRLPYFERTPRAISSISISMPSISIPMPSMPRISVGEWFPSREAVLRVLTRGKNLGARVLAYLFRGAWPSANRGSTAVTRAELDALMPDIVEEARKAAMEEATKVTNAVGGGGSDGSSAKDFVQFVERYAADKGLPADYALRSAGGSIAAASPSLVRMYAKYVREYTESILSDSVFTPAVPRRPVAVLEANVLPGNCWAFEGEYGSLTIKLARPVVPGMVTMEHTPEFSVFSTLGAPRRFRVWGVPVGASRATVGEGDMVLLGEFVFEMGEGKRHLQSFVVERRGEMRAVKFEFLSNHGGRYTSVYRLRVHGKEVRETE